MPRSRDFRSDLMTVEQVADYLQLNKLTVYKYIREGRLPAARLGKAYRIRLSDVDSFLERQMARPGSRAVARPKVVRGQARGRRATPRVEEIAVAPQRRESRATREHGEVSINPMEWVIRGLH
jgi:excisionase family DNA binding protein